MTCGGVDVDHCAVLVCVVFVFVFVFVWVVIESTREYEYILHHCEAQSVVSTGITCGDCCCHLYILCMKHIYGINR